MGLPGESVVQFLDYGGVLVFGLSGASLGARKHFDMVGMLVLAGATGFGGGMMRDVFIGAVPPAALRSPVYVGLAIAATLIVMAAHRVIRRLETQVLVFDAIGLGMFAVNGAAKTLDYGGGWWAAVLLGAISAVGGGVIRDVFAGEVPIIFRVDSGLYATTAALASAATTLCWFNDVFNPFSALLIAVLASLFRLVSLRRSWTAPGPRHVADPYGTDTA